MAKKLIKNFYFTAGLGIDDNLRPNAYALILANRTFIIKEIVAFIQNKIDSGDPDYAGYTYSAAKCERDAGYVIDALLHDLRYGGNEQIVRVASRYWVGTVAQIDGSRIPEIEAYQFAENLINNFIILNILDTSPEQEIDVQVRDLTKTAEDNTDEFVTNLLGIVYDVIENGLSVLPTTVVRLGRLEILGKVDLAELLLITNATDNIVIYNFADPTKGATAEFLEDNSENYPNALTVNNGVTFIRFKTDTSAMSDNDSIQIFVESAETKIRPYDFGTDAIERMRVAQPQAMIDADFEYGLQPTKWQAIGTLRGYPATYEVAASDIVVETIVTDASAGTANVGSSLITVTTQGNHGLEVGDLVTVKALNSAVVGFSRAEGTFLVQTIVSPTEFTYFAKSKVGVTDGDDLYTSTTQLREANFYTGADIGNPTFTVLTNGSSGSFSTALRTLAGGNTLTFIGAVPPNGAPLSGTGIATGTQVTATFGPSTSDGIVDYRTVKTTFSPGASSIALVDISNITANMAVSDGGTPPTILEIVNIAGTTLNLSGLTAFGATGDENIYSGSAIGVTSTGAGLRINLIRSGEGYTYSIAAQGGGYETGDTVRIPGTSVGGSSPLNDIYFNVEENVGGAVTDIIVIDYNAVGLSDGTFNNVLSQPSSTRGTGAIFNVQRAGGRYTLLSITGTPINYYVGNTLRIPGTAFEGTDGVNDVFFRLLTINSSGAIEDAAIIAGGFSAVRGDEIAVYSTVTISQATTSNIIASTIMTYSAIASLEIEFDSPHGLLPGASINIQNTSGEIGHDLAAGPYFVEEVPTPTTIRYTARAAGNIVETVSPVEGFVYARPDSFFVHRPFDGGVQLGTGGPQHGAQAIRQSKKYIRYQSGKGAMYNTGVLFAPSFDVRSITSTGTSTGSIVTVVLDDVDHGIQSGARIRITGVQTTGYDGEYNVSEIVDERSFKFVSTTALGSVTGEVGSQCQMALKNWHGAVIRSGPYDDQNGIFFQYDGNEIAVGRRTSTFQLAGTIAIDSDDNLVTGTNTRFIDQLQTGDRVVIRGMTHVVSSISSNTSMTVTPDFRGVVNVTGVKMSKVQDLIIPQREWNLDKCDGTGPSGYTVDVTKMQMIGIQFSWYGAGFIDWMFRGPDGNYIFCHRLKGNNLNTEAYMRTGNAPVRYEVLNEGARSKLNGAINDSVTTITLDSTRDFPSSGTVYIGNEIITYASKNDTTNQLLSCQREANLINFAAGSPRSYSAGPAASHNDNQGVVLISCTTSPIISHWGSAYLIDGNFDEDRGYIFNYAATGIEISTTKVTAFLIRLAPSVSNAVIGDLGERELINRAQLLLQSISIVSDPVKSDDPLRGVAWSAGASAFSGEYYYYTSNGVKNWYRGTSNGTFSSTPPEFTSGNGSSATYGINLTWSGFTPKNDGGIVIEGVLNPGNYPVNPADISWTALSGPSGGGQPSFAQIANGGSVNWNGGAIANIVNATVTNDVTDTFFAWYAGANFAGTRYALESGDPDWWLPDTDFDTSGMEVGDVYASDNDPSGSFPAGTTIASISRTQVSRGGVNFTRIRMSNGWTGSNRNGTAGTVSIYEITIKKAGTGTVTAPSNRLAFTQASWVSSGVTVGDPVASTELAFPANTRVSSVTEKEYSGVTFYIVSFTQAFRSNISAGSTVSFDLSLPPYALPGEQIFSFITNPGETSTLELDSLKELTNTTIGGRGTFPNGPDVLAINVYKVSGSTTNANIVLRWGEAQA